MYIKTKPLCLRLDTKMINNFIFILIMLNTDHWIRTFNYFERRRSVSLGNCIYIIFILIEISIVLVY